MGIFSKIKSRIQRAEAQKVKIGDQEIFFVKKTKFTFIVNDMIKIIKSIIRNDKFYHRFKEF